MSCVAGSNIIHNGLVLHVDAANEKSYPGTGTVLTDISGNGNHMTLGSSVTFATTSNGIFECPKLVTGIIESDTGPNLVSSNYTVMGFVKISTGTISGRTIAAKSNNWLLGHWNSSQKDYYANGWVNQTGPTSDFIWHLWAATGDITGDSYKAFENGISYTVDTPTGGSQGPNAFSLNRYNAGTEYSDCEIANLIAYDRILTDAEILQNFEALRSRFGI